MLSGTHPNPSKASSSLNRVCYCCEMLGVQVNYFSCWKSNVHVFSLYHVTYAFLHIGRWLAGISLSALIHILFSRWSFAQPRCIRLTWRSCLSESCTFPLGWTWRGRTLSLRLSTMWWSPSTLKAIASGSAWARTTSGWVRHVGPRTQVMVEKMRQGFASLLKHCGGVNPLFLSA